MSKIKGSDLVLDKSEGLITYVENGGDKRCLGFLMPFKEHGVFDANFGRIFDITQEEAEKHNQILSDCLVKGLDETCEVGQGNLFYYDPAKGVTTFTGKVIAPPTMITRTGRTLWFKRGHKEFSAKIKGGDDTSVFVRRTR